MWCVYSTQTSSEIKALAAAAARGAVRCDALTVKGGVGEVPDHHPDGSPNTLLMVANPVFSLLSPRAGLQGATNC